MLYLYVCFVKRNGLPKQDTALYRIKFVMYKGVKQKGISWYE